MRLLKKTHAQRMRLAEKLCAEIKTVLGEGLRAFVVYGPVATNEDGPYSDLELMVITQDDIERLDTEFIRDGIKVGIEFIPFEAAVKKARAIHIIWPVTVYQWHLFLPLYVKEGDDCLRQIQAAAHQALKSDEKFRRGQAARVMNVYEEVLKLKNAMEADARSDLLTNLRNFCFYSRLLMSFANRYFYRNQLNAWEESKKLANLPADYARLIGIVHGEVETDLQTRYNAALQLWDNICEWAAKQGIEWETRSELTLPKQKEA